MNKFIKKLLLFFSIYLLYLGLAYWIDPYDLFRTETNQRLNELESKIAFPINQRLYLLKQYTENPSDVVLLGDSRTQSLSASLVEKLTNRSTANLAFGAAAISEIIDTFWYVTKIHDVHEVYIGLNFNLFNEFDYSGKAKEAIQLMGSPERYFFSKYCYKSLYHIIKAILTGRETEFGKPQVSKEEFWHYQLDSTAVLFYNKYKYPENYESGLKEISSYCEEKGIRLVFFIPPTHIDLQAIVKDFNLESEEKAFKMFLSNNGKLLDFDYPSDITSSYDNFLDPFHFNDSISQIIIGKIVSYCENE